MSLCVLAGGKTIVLAAAAFTLSWTHSVEKIRWTEHWRVTPAGLVVDMGRVEGSALAEAGPGGVRRDRRRMVALRRGPALPYARREGRAADLNRALSRQGRMNHEKTE
jgi:hypothetical protein